MTQTHLQVEGMTCGHCAHTVQQALASVPGVQSAKVSLDQKEAVVVSEGPLNLPRATQAVEEEGYKIHPIVKEG